MKKFIAVIVLLVTPLLLIINNVFIITICFPFVTLSAFFEGLGKGFKDAAIAVSQSFFGMISVIQNCVDVLVDKKDKQ